MANEQQEFKFPDEEDASNTTTTITNPSEDKDKIEIEVVDDTPPEDRGRQQMTEPPADPTDEELNQYSEGARKRIQHFTKGYHEERRAKETAEREKEEAVRFAQQLAEENKKLKGSLSQGQTVILDQAKKSVEIELEAAKRAYKEAHEKGDTDALLQAQEALTTAKIKADRLNSFKPAPTTPPQAQDTEVQSTQQAQQPTQSVDPKVKSWMAKNTWFGSNDEMTALALVVHRKLAQRGVDTNSDEYYKAIDKRMREVFPNEFESDSSSKDDANSSSITQNTQSKSATVVAPATRSTAPKKIVLTKSQVAIAKRLNVPLELYAKQVAAQMRKQNG